MSGGHRVSVSQDEKGSGDGWGLVAVGMYLTLLNCVLKNDEDVKFYVMSIFKPQFKKIFKSHNKNYRIYGKNGVKV